MNRVLIIGLLAAAAPAAAVTPTFDVVFAGPTGVPSNNEYKDALAAAGLSNVAKSATVSVTGRGKVSYTYVGSESGLVDRFTDGAVGPFAETNPGVSVFDPTVQRPFAPVSLGSTVYAGAGSLTGTYLSGTGDTIAPGSVRFGVFTPSSAATTLTNSTIYFSLDDRPTGDGDFDDFIIKATISAVPEPASWMLMITGFGLVGVASRSRRTASAISA